MSAQQWQEQISALQKQTMMLREITQKQKEDIARTRAEKEHFQRLCINMTADHKGLLDAHKHPHVTGKGMPATSQNHQATHKDLEITHKGLLSAYQKVLEENSRMSFNLDQLRRLLFGSKRERFISNEQANQLVLPFEGDPIPEPDKQPEQIDVTYKRPRYTKSHPGRTKLPDHLPVEEIYLDPEESTEGMKCIGKEVTDKLDYIPGTLKIKRYIRNKYITEQKQDEHQVLIADLPAFPIEKGIPEAGLLAQIIIDKYVDHLPLYRQLERFKREGIHIAPSTVDSWIVQIARLLEPLYDYIRNTILSQGYVQADESPIKVLDRNKKGTTHQGYFWVYHSPLLEAVFFDYQMGRSRDGPKKLLKNFTGYLQTDGYSVYDYFGTQKGITLVGCMAHARRKFEQALDYDYLKASMVMSLIQKLYDVEREARNGKLTPAERKELRLDKALPKANDLSKLMVEMYQGVLPKSPLGKALGYTMHRWDNLLAYLKDGSLEIDNNLIENSIRPSAIGKRNYLFAGSHEGAKRSAIFYTLLGTCKMHGVNPWQWFKKVLELMPTHHANKLDELLPKNLEL